MNTPRLEQETPLISNAASRVGHLVWVTLTTNPTARSAVSYLSPDVKRVARHKSPAEPYLHCETAVLTLRVFEEIAKSNRGAGSANDGAHEPT